MLPYVIGAAIVALLMSWLLQGETEKSKANKYLKELEKLSVEGHALLESGRQLMEKCGCDDCKTYLAVTQKLQAGAEPETSKRTDSEK